MQKLINKNLKLKSGVEVISHCITKGLHVTASFIYGFPEETEEDLSQTLKMIIELHNNGCNILTNMCHIMNGTDLYNRYGKSLVITENISYNKSIIAFEELYGLISSNRDIFPNFYDYPTELRKSMTYLDIYRFALLYCKIHMPEVHLFLQAHNYGSLDMYKMFCNANSDIITEGDIPSNGDPNKMISKMKRLPDLVYNQLIKNLVTLINGNKTLRILLYLGKFPGYGFDVDGGSILAKQLIDSLKSYSKLDVVFIRKNKEEYHDEFVNSVRYVEYKYAKKINSFAVLII